jgi:hypothetical protein
MMISKYAMIRIYRRNSKGSKRPEEVRSCSVETGVDVPHKTAAAKAGYSKPTLTLLRAFHTCA